MRSIHLRQKEHFMGPSTARLRLTLVGAVSTALFAAFRAAITRWREECAHCALPAPPGETTIGLTAEGETFVQFACALQAEQLAGDGAMAIRRSLGKLAVRYRSCHVRRARIDVGYDTTYVDLRDGSVRTAPERATADA